MEPLRVGGWVLISPEFSSPHLIFKMDNIGDVIPKENGKRRPHYRHRRNHSVCHRCRRCANTTAAANPIPTTPPFIPTAPIEVDVRKLLAKEEMVVAFLHHTGHPIPRRLLYLRHFSFIRPHLLLACILCPFPLHHPFTRYRFNPHLPRLRLRPFRHLLPSFHLLLFPDT